MGAWRWIVMAGVFATPSWAVSWCTFNVQNYGEVGRRVEGTYEKAYPKPEEEKAGLRRTLLEIRADVVALQEMGSRAHLEELQRDLRREGLDYPEAFWLEAEDKERHLALLCKQAPERVELHEHVPLGSSGKCVKRGVLEAVFNVEGVEVALFVVHLKSRLTSDPQDPEGGERRGAEAEAIRKLILGRFPNPGEACYAVVGDFNDGPKSRPLRAFLHVGNREISRMVPAEDSRGERWTHHYGREDVYSRVDYVLLSPAAFRVLAPRARVVDLKPGPAPSDHRPVVVEFTRVTQTPASTLAP